jgi:hypothetical protein
MKEITILDAMTDPRIFGPWFSDPSWDAWKAFLCALFALPMSEVQVELFRHHTGREMPPFAPCREAWVCAGRRSGKSIVAALISIYLSLFRDYGPHLGPGEVSTAMVVSPDRRQSRTIGRFQRGFVRQIPMFSAMVTGETKESLEFLNRTVCETQTADPSTLRSYTSHLIINDEIAYLPTENSAEPDTEILIAERPCLASIPNSLLLSISSPYSRRGSLFAAYEEHFAKDHDPVLFWQSSSLEMNPTLDARIVTAAYEQDPSAAAEYGGKFRTDCEQVFNPQMLDRVTDYARPEILPPCFDEATA